MSTNEGEEKRSVSIGRRYCLLHVGVVCIGGVCWLGYGMPGYLSTDSTYSTHYLDVENLRTPRFHPSCALQGVAPHACLRVDSPDMA